MPPQRLSQNLDNILCLNSLFPCPLKEPGNGPDFPGFEIPLEHLLQHLIRLLRGNTNLKKSSYRVHETPCYLGVSSNPDENFLQNLGRHGELQREHQVLEDAFPSRNSCLLKEGPGFLQGFLSPVQRLNEVLRRDILDEALPELLEKEFLRRILGVSKD